MRKIRAHRMQYGIGQGGFHTQSIHWHPHAESKERSFDFVFDCGAKKANQHRLNWAIKNYRPKQTLAKPHTPRVVDALFISHFHDDHLSGIKELCAANKVERIFAPFLADDEILSIVAESSYSLPGTSLDDIENFLQQIHHLKTRTALFSVPTIYLTPDGDQVLDPAPDFGSDEINWVAGAIRISPTNAHNNSAWEIRSWCYRDGDKTLTEDIAERIKSLPNCPACLYSSAKCSAGDAIWLQNNLSNIQSIYAEALLGAALTDSATAPRHQNQTSLCVYSGPTPDNHLGCSSRSLGEYEYCTFSRIFCYDEKERIGWLGSGDAEFGKPNVWDDFCLKPNFLSRLRLTGTIQIPHHGSSNNNYRRELVEYGRPIAVISCSTDNSHNHPGQAILNDLLEAGARPIVVTEHTHPGFHEYVELNI